MVGKHMQPWSGLYLTGMFETAWPKLATAQLVNTVKLAETAWPKLATAELVRDVAIVARRLESELQRELNAGGLDADVVTWWTCLSPQLRAATVMTIVWIYVLARLVTWSADHPDVSNYIQDRTVLLRSR